MTTLARGFLMVWLVMAASGLVYVLSFPMAGFLCAVAMGLGVEMTVQWVAVGVWVPAMCSLLWLFWDLDDLPDDDGDDGDTLDEHPAPLPPPGQVVDVVFEEIDPKRPFQLN
ncbi:MAG: hypothetical protein AAGI52_06480 [Bacteroidota bacterium]